MGVLVCDWVEVGTRLAGRAGSFGVRVISGSGVEAVSSSIAGVASGTMFS